MLKKQAVVNAGLLFELYDEESGETFQYCYENGIRDYLAELNGENGLTAVHYLRPKPRDATERISPNIA